MRQVPGSVLDLSLERQLCRLCEEISDGRQLHPVGRLCEPSEAWQRPCHGRRQWTFLGEHPQAVCAPLDALPLPSHCHRVHCCVSLVCPFTSLGFNSVNPERKRFNRYFLCLLVTGRFKSVFGHGCALPWALTLLDGEKGAKGSADQPESYIPARHNVSKVWRDTNQGGVTIKAWGGRRC